MGNTFLTCSIKQLFGLGGKNAAVVFDDADLDKCVKVRYSTKIFIIIL